jgi:hypothetical protein
MHWPRPQGLDRYQTLTQNQTQTQTQTQTQNQNQSQSQTQTHIQTSSLRHFDQPRDIPYCHSHNN